VTQPQLVATAWTSAGNTSPMRTPATSPVPIAERVAAVTDAGYAGFGLIADDLLAIRDSIGFAALRDMIAAVGLTHVEIELIERWWLPSGVAGNTCAVRELLFDAADVLAPAFIKIGLGERSGHRRSAGAGRSAPRTGRPGGCAPNTGGHRADALLRHRDGTHGRADR
jgi:sugar phosphate isomerase/epimerase